MGFFRQYASQHDIPSKVIYVQGSWLSSFVFKVTSTRFELKEDFSSLDIRICPESLVERVRTTVLPLTFQPFHIRGSERQVDNLLAALRDIAADPRQCSSGWLGHFSLKQMDLLENIFEQVDHLLAVLRDFAADPRQCSSGWLGHFSLEQMDLLEKWSSAME